MTNPRKLKSASMFKVLVFKKDVFKNVLHVDSLFSKINLGPTCWLDLKISLRYPK